MSTLTPVSSSPVVSGSDVRRSRTSVPAAAPVAESTSRAPSASEQIAQVEQAIERLKQSLKPTLANTLQFEIDKGTGRTIVKIIDTETQTIVRQIPSEEVIAISDALDRVQNRGLLVRQKA